MTLRHMMERAVRRGWYIFPIEGKQPLCQWRDASARVVPNHPRQTGYGIDTGKSNLIVLDVDGPAGAESLAALSDPPRTYSVKTPHGVHYYFRPLGLRAQNSASKIAPGLDIRAVGGYVVGAGSEFDGEKYRVDQTNLTLTAAVPTWLVDEIQRCQTRVPQLDSKCTGTTDTGILLGGGPVSRFIRGETGLGERNHSFHAFFTWTAWNVHLPSDLAWEWWTQLNAELEVPEDDIAQVEATMESAYRAPPEDASSPRPARGSGDSPVSYRDTPRDQRVAQRVAEREAE